MPDSCSLGEHGLYKGMYYEVISVGKIGTEI